MLKLQIKNYKSIGDIKYNIRNNINYIIGKNESGKSNVIGAINELNNDNIKNEFRNFNTLGEAKIDFKYLVVGPLAKEWKNLLGLSDVWISRVIDEEGVKYYRQQTFNTKLWQKLKPLYVMAESLEKDQIISSILNNSFILKEGKQDTDNILGKLKDLIDKSFKFKNMYNVTHYNQEDFPYLKKTYTFIEAKQDPTFLALWNLLKQDVDKIDQLITLTGDDQLDLKNDLEDKLSIELDSFIDDFWKQKTIRFKIDIKDSEFVVRAADLFTSKTGKFKNLDLRSSGMISYLTLVLFISSLDLSRENIVLLDEPASKLHFSAVLDLKKFFEKSHSKIKFVVATHNTAFIDWNNIDKFSLALKENDQKGTELITKFIQKSIGEDKSGLSPFLYKLGIDKDALFSVSSNINVFVEGVHDLILLRAMYGIYKTKENKTMDLNFIPIGSATKNSSLIYLSFATNLNRPYFIFDNDDAGESGVKKIKKEFYGGEEQNNIFFITGKDVKDGQKIETQDLFLEEKFQEKIIRKNKSFDYYHSLAKAITNEEHVPSKDVYNEFKKVFDRINK